MTQRPVPAARYSRLLNQEIDEDRKSSTASTTTRHPIFEQHTLVGFSIGTLSTLAILVLSYLLFSQRLSTALCVTPYTQQVDFVPHPEYSNLSSQYDALWDEILPANGGFLADTKFGITMFHQLHCLQLLRIGLQKAHDEDKDGGMVMDSHGHNMHANPTHYLHCLDYLRQGVLCAADSTIEQTIERKTPGRKLVDGYVRHRCGDSRRLYDLVESSLAGGS